MSITLLITSIPPFFGVGLEVTKYWEAKKLGGCSHVLSRVFFALQAMAGHQKTTLEVHFKRNLWRKAATFFLNSRGMIIIQLECS
ncbi:MAG TPA: hypothetical protein VHS96_10320 [Bacteroidia bacterium]|nr:hypothetical protein [Bacteroidia bacterium]